MTSTRFVSAGFGVVMAAAAAVDAHGPALIAAAAAGHSVFGPRDRWRAMLADLRAAGAEHEPQRRTARDAVLTVPWSTVAPRSRA